MQIQEEYNRIDQKYITQTMTTARVFNEKDRQDEFQKLQKESQDAFKKNDVLIFPSLKLKCLDKMPRVDIVEADMRFLKKKLPKSQRSTAVVIRKLLCDYI